MKRLINALCLIMVLVVAGCSNSTQEKQIIVKAENTQPEKLKEAQLINQPLSITEYQEEINGKNLRNGILNITQNGNILTLDMDLQFSDDLKDLMKRTKNNFSFTLIEVTGSHRLNEIVNEWASPVDGHEVIHNIPATGAIYHFHQEIKLKENATSDEVSFATNQANYMFATLNEQQQMVAATIGLDAGTIQQ